MFKFSEWVIRGIIEGYATGEMSFAKVTELTANYLVKGIITQEQAEKVAKECPMPTEIVQTEYKNYAEEV